MSHRCLAALVLISVVLILLQFLGEWVLVESFTDQPQGDQFLTDVSSSHMELRLLPDNKVMYNERNLYQ